MALTAAPKTTAVKVKLPGVTAPQNAVASTAAPVDYKNLLANDYGVIQSNANINAQGLTDQAALTAARQRALVQYGSIPTAGTASTGDLSGAIDDTTRQLAAQATAGGVSTVAQLNKAYDTHRQASNASLAARGLLHSGAYGQHANEDLSNYNQAGYQASQQLLDYLSGLYSGYQSHQSDLRQQGLQSQNDALDRLIAQINAGTISGGAGTPGYGGGAEVYGNASRPEYTYQGETVAPITYQSMSATPTGIPQGLVQPPVNEAAPMTLPHIPQPVLRKPVAAPSKSGRTLSVGMRIQ